MPRPILLMTLALVAAALPPARLASAQPRNVATERTASMYRILLTNGELLTGRYHREVDRIVITTHRGATLRIPDRDVLHIAATDADAFLFLRRTSDPGRIDDVLKLAGWALQHQLFDECARELAQARELDPTHEGIPSLEARLTQARTRVAHGGRAPVTQRPVPTDRAPSKALATPTGAGGTKTRHYTELTAIERAQLASFAQHAQPLILNRCATAGCHQTNTSDYQLRVPLARTGISSLQSIANFEATMRFVNRSAPTDSQLLSAIRHNDAHRSFLLSGTGDATLSRLTQWVHSISSPRATTDAVSDRPPTRSATVNGSPDLSVTTTSGVEKPPGVSATASPADSAGPQGSPAVSSTGEPTLGRDAYDPHEFNRLAPNGPAGDEEHR